MKAIVFDLDGIIVDSLQLNFEVKKAIFKPFGVQPTLKEFKEIWVSPRDHAKSRIGYFIKSKHLLIDEKEVRKKQGKIYAEYYRKKSVLMPGILRLIGLFKKKGLRLGIVSSNEKRNVNVVLKKFRLAKKFDFVICAEDCEKSKPHPEPYLLAARKFALKPSEIVVFEDTESGVKSAKLAGCKVVAVPNKFTRHGNFSKADLVAGSLREITLSGLKKL